MEGFNFFYYMVMVVAIMYLFSSGKPYMEYAAETAGRAHWTDKVELGFLAAMAFCLAFYPSLSNWFNYAIMLPLWIHLIHIAYLSHKHKKHE